MATPSLPPEPPRHVPPEDHERDSGMRIDFTLSIGYSRRRPNVLGDRWEARVDSIGLLLAGALVAIVILIITVPRILAALAI